MTLSIHYTLSLLFIICKGFTHAQSPYFDDAQIKNASYQQAVTTPWLSRLLPYDSLKFEEKTHTVLDSLFALPVSQTRDYIGTQILALATGILPFEKAKPLQDKFLLYAQDSLAIAESSKSFALRYVIHSNMKAPTWAVKNLSGQSVDVGDFQGKEVVIYFWRTDCKPCIKEIAKIEKEAIPADFLPLFICTSSSFAEWKTFIRKRKWTGLHLCDISEKTAKSYGVTLTPYTVRLNKTGEITQIK